MNTNEDGLRQITETVWSSALLLDIAFDGAPMPSGPVLVGRVRFHGAWTGALDVWCSDDGARRAATAMFGVEPEHADDLRDAVGELANMVAGNFKVLLPGPTTISTPRVRLDPSRAGPSEADITFSSGGAAYRVTLFGAAVVEE